MISTFATLLTTVRAQARAVEREALEGLAKAARNVLAMDPQGFHRLPDGARWVIYDLADALNAYDAAIRALPTDAPGDDGPDGRRRG